jgi:hypothetical protein
VSLSFFASYKSLVYRNSLINLAILLLDMMKLLCVIYCILCNLLKTTKILRNYATLNERILGLHNLDINLEYIQMHITMILFHSLNYSFNIPPRVPSKNHDQHQIRLEISTHTFSSCRSKNFSINLCQSLLFII